MCRHLFKMALLRSRLALVTRAGWWIPRITFSGASGCSRACATCQRLVWTSTWRGFSGQCGITMPIWRRGNRDMIINLKTQLVDFKGQPIEMDEQICPTCRRPIAPTKTILGDVLLEDQVRKFYAPVVPGQVCDLLEPPKS